MTADAAVWKEGFAKRGAPPLTEPPPPSRPQRQCIMIACAADSSAAEALRDFRVHDLLRTPVTMPALRRMLHKWLPSPAQSVDLEVLLDAATAAARSPKRCKANVLRSARILQALDIARPSMRYGARTEGVASTWQVENCPISVLAVATLFQQLGFWIDTVPNGESAMARPSPRRYTRERYLYCTRNMVSS